MAPADLGWHWESGDPVAASRYGVMVGIFLAAGAVFLAILLLDLVDLVRHPTAPRPPVDWLVVAIYPPLAVELLGGWYVPRRFAVVGRLGVSSAGIRLVLPVAGRTFRWSDVRGVGPYWIDLFDVVLTQRFRLTPNQAGCVAWCLGRPLSG